MKKTLLALFSVFSIVFFTQLFNNNNVHGNSSGSPAGYTGSPLEFSGRTCGSGGGCHGGGSTFQTNMITSNIPVSGYVVGQTYQITATVVSVGRTKFGFQLSPQRANGNTAGTLIGNAQVQVTGSQRYVTHNSSSNTGTGSRSWTFNWTAPATGFGPVTFYAAFNAANNNGGTSGDIILNSSLIVNEETPQLDIAIEGEPEICPGESVTLTSNIATGNQWSLNGSPINGANGTSIAASTGGTYSVSNGGQTAQVVIILNSAPSTPIISTSNPQNLLCNGASLTLSTTSQDIVEWSNGVFAPSIIITQPGTYTVTVTNNCGASTSAPVVVTSGNTPAVPVITVNGTTTFCVGTGNTTLQSSTSNGTLIWQPGSVNANTLNPSASGNYTVTATNSCGSATSLPTVITVLAPPALPTISANGPNTICNGTIITLTATPSENTVWQPTNENGSSLQVGISGSYTATNSNSCGNISSLPFVLNVTNQPTQPVIEGQFILENYCDGDSVLLEVQLAPGDSAVWLPFNISSNSIIASSTANYSVQVFSSCGNAISNEVPLVFLEIPATPFIIQSNDSLFATATLANQYQWLKDGIGIAGATNNFFIPTVNGIYTVQAINSNGAPCISNLSNEVNVVISSIDKKNNLLFSIFPNPALETIQLQFNFDNNQQYSNYEILDLQGRSIQKAKLETNAVISVVNLENGVYQLIVSKKGVLGRMSFIKL